MRVIDPALNGRLAKGLINTAEAVAGKETDVAGERVRAGLGGGGRCSSGLGSGREGKRSGQGG